MKHIATVALMLNLGVAGVYAQHRPIKMTFSGSNVATTINLQPGTVTDEQIVAGTGTLGPFTFRELHADGPSPQPSASCSGPYFLVVAGAGVFRFQNGSLLTVRITDGNGCVDLAEGRPPHRDLPDYRRNRAFQGCVRQPYIRRRWSRSCATPLTRPHF